MQSSLNKWLKALAFLTVFFELAHSFIELIRDFS